MNVIWTILCFGPSSAGSDIGGRSVRMSQVRRFGKVLTLLREENLSPFGLVLEILDDCKPEYTGYRVELYKDDSTRLPRILDYFCRGLWLSKALVTHWRSAPTAARHCHRNSGKIKCGAPGCHGQGRARSAIIVEGPTPLVVGIDAAESLSSLSLRRCGIAK
jgi:hypothetical protein